MCFSFTSLRPSTNQIEIEKFFTLLCFRSVLNLQDGSFSLGPQKPTGWTHIVFNYIGPNNGHGIRIYYNGMEMASDTVKSEASYSPGDGRIVVGKIFTNENHLYATMEVDDLIFFNHHLTFEEIATLGNEI